MGIPPKLTKKKEGSELDKKRRNLGKKRSNLDKKKLIEKMIRLHKC